MKSCQCCEVSYWLFLDTHIYFSTNTNTCSNTDTNMCSSMETNMCTSMETNREKNVDNEMMMRSVEQVAVPRWLGAHWIPD